MSVVGKNVNQREAVVDVNRADSFAGNISFVGNRANNIADADAARASDVDEKARHSFARLRKWFGRGF